MRDLTDKVAWITGAGTGIGEAGALALADAGMYVVLSGRREEPLHQLAERIGTRAWVQPLDVSDKDVVSCGASTLLDRYGRCDILVNSAGINVRNRHWHNVSVDERDQIVRIDLDGTLYCCKAILPAMTEQKDGLIINVSSWAGKYTSMITGPAYSAAKHAVNSMTESLNMELGIHGIRACAICPGEVATPILEKRPVPVSDEDKAKMIQAEDCGEIISFIARLPKHVCINEMTISPTWNRMFAAQAQEL